MAFRAPISISAKILTKGVRKYLPNWIVRNMDSYDLPLGQTTLTPRKFRIGRGGNLIKFGASQLPSAGVQYYVSEGLHGLTKRPIRTRIRKYHMFGYYPSRRYGYRGYRRYRSYRRYSRYASRRYG